MDIRSSRSLLASIQKRAGTKPDGCGVRSDQLAVIERLHLSRGRLGIAPNVVTAEDMSACVCGLTTYDSAWEHVALAALVLKECLAVCPGTDGTANGDIAALSAIAKAVLVDVIIGHHEPRVRGVGSELIGALAAKLGPSCFSDMSPVLFSEASKIFERRDLSREARLGGQSEIALDDTTGWHALESLLCSYRELVAGCGPQLQYLERAPQEQFDLFIRDAAAHMNRHIRQVTFEFIHVVMNQALPGSLRWVNGDRIEMLCHCVSAGLADDFSQVRLPATYAAKYYLISLNDGDRDMYAWPKLLPRVCLNRYYPADGVKSASQEAWAAVTKGSGRALVTQHIAEAFDYYDAMTKNNSHLICEAACWVLGELGSIIDAEAVAPFLQRLLNLLGVCLGDDSWQVRGAACVATGRVIKAHPYATCEVACEKFLPLWVHHLNDYIWALRSDSAAALGVAFRSPAERLSVEATEAAVQYLNENLAAAKKTKTAFSFIPSTSSLYAFLKNKPTESIPTRQAPQTERSISNAQSRQRFGVVELRRRPGVCIAQASYLDVLMCF